MAQADLQPLNASELADVSGQAGIDLTVEADIQTDNLSLTDTDGDGVNGAAGVMNFYNFSLTSDGPLSMSIDLIGAYDHDNNAGTEDRAAVSIDVADLDANNAAIKLGTLQLAGNTNPVGYMYFEGFHWSDVHAYIASGGTSGQGMTVNWQGKIRIDDFQLVDSADPNSPGSGTAAVGLIGIELSADYTDPDAGPFQVSNLTLSLIHI